MELSVPAHGVSALSVKITDLFAGHTNGAASAPAQAGPSAKRSKKGKKKTQGAASAVDYLSVTPINQSEDFLSEVPARTDGGNMLCFLAT